MIATLEQTLCPPGPPQPVSVRAVRSQPLAFLQDLAARYGDIVRYQADGWTTTLINHPDYVRHVLHDQWSAYTKEGTPDLLMLRPMLGRGLLTTEGSEWLWLRRMSQPAFHRQQVSAMAGIMVKHTDAMLDAWNQQPPDGPIEISEAMSHLTLAIAAEAFFGYSIQGKSDAFGQSVEALNECTGHLDPTDPVTVDRYHRALAIIHRVVNQIIRVRQWSGLRPPDFLSLMMDARDEVGAPMSAVQLRDQVLTLLLAGHETTAKALAWTLYLVDAHPDVAARLHEEIAAVLGERLPTAADVAQMPYTWMVIQEAMRFRPPVWSVSRMARVDDRIGSFDIPAGSLVTLSPYLLHRHPDFWATPEQFNPDHFTPEAVAARPAMAFIPFSGGPRLCIGRPFAELEMRLVLPMILQRFRPALVSGHPVEVEALVTLRARYGLPMQLVPAPQAGGNAR